MLSKLLEYLTGKDDLERVVAKGDPRLLTDVLKTRPMWILRKPRRYLDPATSTRDQRLKLLEEDSRSLLEDPFDPWVLETDGIMHLTAFSSPKRITSFSKRISEHLGKQIAIGCLEVPIAEAIKGLEIDFVCINMYSAKSWVIHLGSLGKPDRLAEGTPRPKRMARFRIL